MSDTPSAAHINIHNAPKFGRRCGLEAIEYAEQHDLPEVRFDDPRAGLRHVRLAEAREIAEVMPDLISVDAVRNGHYGSLFYRKDLERWAVRIPVPGYRTAGGRVKYRYFLVDSKRDAERVLRDLRRARETGGLVVKPAKAAKDEPVAAKHLALTEAINEFIGAKVAEGKSARTIQHYRSILHRVTGHPIARMPVEEVRPENVEAYMAWRRERVYKVHHVCGCSSKAQRSVERRADAAASKVTVNRDMNLISASLGRLARLGHLKENPCARVALSKEEAVRLIEACADRFRPLVVEALFTGARRGELLALTWGDVNLDSHTVVIRRSKVANASRTELHPVLEQELRRMRDAIIAEPRIPANAEPIFLNARGREPR